MTHTIKHITASATIFVALAILGSSFAYASEVTGVLSSGSTSGSSGNSTTGSVTGTVTSPSSGGSGGGSGGGGTSASNGPVAGSLAVSGGNGPISGSIGTTNSGGSPTVTGSIGSTAPQGQVLGASTVRPPIVSVGNADTSLAIGGDVTPIVIPSTAVDTSQFAAVAAANFDWTMGVWLGLGLLLLLVVGYYVYRQYYPLKTRRFRPF